jgi:hypothetical protein
MIAKLMNNMLILLVASYYCTIFMVFIPQQTSLTGAPQKGNTLAPSQQRDNIDWLCKRAIGFLSQAASTEKNSQNWKPEDYVWKHGLDIFL